MKKIIIFVFSAMLLFTESVSSNEDFKRVIMTVDGASVTRIDIIREVNSLIPTTIYHSTVSKKKLEELEQEAKEKLIERKLLFLYGKKIGIIIPPSAILKQEKKSITAFHSKEKFYEALSKSHYTLEEFRKGVEEEMIVDEVIKREVTADFTEKELKRYYEENKNKFKEPEKIKASLIYIQNDPADPKGKENARKKAEEAFGKIGEGKSFADIAALYSEDMYRIKGGDMGYIHKGRLNEDIDKVAFSLVAGEMSGILENTLGCFIVKVEDKKMPNQLTFEDVKGKLKRELIETTEKKRRNTLLGRLKKDAQIKIISE